MEYLQKGGRIGKASAIIGGLLNIKPVLQVKNGEVAPFTKKRGTKKALTAMIELFSAYLQENDKDNTSRE